MKFKQVRVNGRGNRESLQVANGNPPFVRGQGP